MLGFERQASCGAGRKEPARARHSASVASQQRHPPPARIVSYLISQRTKSILSDLKSRAHSGEDGDYARAQAEGVECVPLLVETFGGLSPALTSVLREAADWRSNKLTSSEYDETTWSARTWLTFVAQRISVAVQLSMAQEAAEALGLSVAADPRAR